MAAVIHNVALGRVNEFPLRVDGNDPTNSILVVRLWQFHASAASLATLQDLDTLAEVEAAANVDVCDFTNYADITLDDGDIGATVVDDSGNTQYFDTTDFLWSAAGGASDNDIGLLTVAYHPDSTSYDDTETTCIMTSDFVGSTNGGDVTGQIDSGGLWVAAAA